MDEIGRKLATAASRERKSGKPVRVLLSIGRLRLKGLLDM
jgi:hypothetical protein